MPRLSQIIEKMEYYEVTLQQDSWYVLDRLQAKSVFHALDLTFPQLVLYF